MLVWDKLPDEMKALPNWVCWNSKKIPINPKDGSHAKSNDPMTWGTYLQACEFAEKGDVRGIGFMFSHSPYFGVDIDDCIGADGVPNAQALEIISMLDSYTERSQSGKGIHIIARGSLPAGRRRSGNLEMYDEGRYFALTADIYDGKSKIVDAGLEIKKVHARFFGGDDKRKVIARIMADVKAKELFLGNWQKHYGSQSEADLALCNVIAYWADKNADIVDAVFRESKLMRDKWDEFRGSETYGQMTVAKSCEPSSDGGYGAYSDDDKKEYDKNDTGNAQRFFDKHGMNLHYSYQNKAWYVWDGKMWMRDLEGVVNKLLDATLAEMKENGDNEAWVKQCGNSSRKSNALKETQHLGNIPILTEQMDTQKQLMCVNDCVINLQNGQRLPHDQGYVQTRRSFVDYGETSVCPTWLRFLDEVFQGDKELIAFFQRAFGYSLTGYISEQCMFILWGLGRNGKSTLLAIMSEVAGMYATHAQPETIMVKGNMTNIPTDIARLHGARMVTTTEPNRDNSLNEGLIKQLTGEDKVTARFLYGDEFEYVPQFKIWLGSNYKPHIVGTDDGIWRRIKLIPMTAFIPNPDRKMIDKLRAELPEILRWAVEGAIMWFKEGLGTCAKIEEATHQYRADSDVLAQFLGECVLLGVNGSQVSAKDLYNRYVEWCKESNSDYMNGNLFGRVMSEKHASLRKRTTAGGVYTGMKLIENWKD